VIVDRGGDGDGDGGVKKELSVIDMIWDEASQLSMVSVWYPAVQIEVYMYYMY
jgi:hypothetical protein